MPLNEFAEFFAVFVSHVHEFDAAAIRPDVADDGGEIDLEEAGADFELDRVPNSEFPWGLQISATQADGLHTRKARWHALDLSAKRRFKWNSRIAAGNYIAGTRLSGRSERSRRLLERRTVFDQGQRIFRRGAQPRRFRVSEALATLRQLAKKLGGFRGAHSAKRFDGLDAHKLVAQNLVFTGSDFHQLRDGSRFLRQTELVDHHGNDHGMRVRKDCREDESSVQRR